MTVAEAVQAMEGQNAYAVLAYVQRELRKRKLQAEIERFMEQATAGDYTNLCETAEKFATACDEIDADGEDAMCVPCNRPKAVCKCWNENDGENY